MILLPSSVGVQEVQRVARGSLEPAHVLRLAVARQHADHRRQLAVPIPHRLAALEPLEARRARDDRNQNVLLRDRDVVDDPEVRRLEPHLFDDVAVGVDRVDRDVLREDALRLVAVRDHLPGQRIDLRMRRHARRLPLAVEVPAAERLERMRIEVVRQRIFFERDQLAAVPIDMSVRGAAVDVRDARVVRVRVAVHAQEALARLALGHQALRSSRSAHLKSTEPFAKRNVLTWPSPLKPVSHSFFGGGYAKSHCIR